MINTPASEKARSDDHQIRRATLQFGIAYTTTLAGATAFVSAIESMVKNRGIRIRTLQEFHAAIAPS